MSDNIDMFMSQINIVMHDALLNTTKAIEEINEKM